MLSGFKKERKTQEKGEKRFISPWQNFILGIRALSLLCTSHLDLTFKNGSPQDTQGGNVYAVTAYHCLGSWESYQGKSLFTQQEPIMLKTCHSRPASRLSHSRSQLEWKYKVAWQVKREKERRLNHEREPCLCVIPKHGVHRLFDTHWPVHREEWDKVSSFGCFIRTFLVMMTL